MLFTEAQNQFKSQEERALHGQPMSLEAGYREAYANWSQENTIILPKLSPEERALSFSDYIEARVLEKQREWIEAKEKDPSKKKVLLGQAQRGDLLFVSTNEGQDFNQVMTVEEAQRQDTLTLRVLSSSLRSTTTNLTEVKEEQNMLHVVAKLREQHFLVEHVYVENHRVHAQVTHPRSGAYEVVVPLDQNPALPFVYEFVNQKGTQRVQETQLPEEYGEAVGKWNLEKTDIKQMMAEEMLQNQKTERSGQENLAKQAVLSSMFAQMALQNTHLPLTPLERGNQAAEQTRIQMSSPILHQNTLATKAATAARKARQDKELADEKKRILDRVAKSPVANAEAHKKKQEEEKKQHDIVHQTTSHARKALALGTGAAAGIFAGGSSVIFMLIHSSHS